MLRAMTSLTDTTDLAPGAVSSDAIGLEPDAHVIGLAPVDWPTGAFDPLVPASLEALDLKYERLSARRPGVRDEPVC